MHLKTKTALTRLMIGVAATFAVSMAASPAYAGTATSSLNVSATVSQNCTITTTGVVFGSVDVISGFSVDSIGQISVACTNGTAWTASANAGGGAGATLSDRKMVNGTNLLSYDLYTDAARTMIWGDGVGGATATIADIGTGAPKNKSIYGRIPPSQVTMPAGTYTDTVTVTVTY